MASSGVSTGPHLHFEVHDPSNNVIEPFDVGEISIHSGWVFHRAGANQTNETRKVMTIIYMDKDMKLKEPSNDGQQNDWETWCPGVEIGEVINSPINPILYTNEA